MQINQLSTPKATKRPFEITTHGHTRTDNYYWLRDRENPEVIAYLEAENAYCASVLAPYNALQEKLFTEMKARIKETDASVPYQIDDYFYYSRFQEGGEYPIYCRKKGNLDANEEILLDGNNLAKDHAYFHIGGYAISDNEQMMAFGIDTVSRRNYTVQFKNLVTGELYSEKIEHTEAGNYAWAADNQSFFYVLREQETLLGYRVYRHQLGTAQEEDVLVYEEKDNQFGLGLYRMKSKKYIAIISVQNGVSTEYQLLDAAKPTGDWFVFLEREEGHEYYLEHVQDTFFIRTNTQHAANFQLMEVPEKEIQNGISAWQTVIPAREDVMLETFEIFTHFLVIQERKEGLAQLVIRNLKTKEEHQLDFGEPVYDAFIGTNPNFNTSVLRYGYTSLTTPFSTFDYNMETREKVLRKEQIVLGDFTKENYQTERVFATARDGVKIPISLVYKKTTPIDGTAPLLQYAYGSYGINMDASFSSRLLSLLDRGFVYAICHIRGGQEMGRKWYDEGKMNAKMNTFTDFMDCSSFLIANKWADASRLFAMGGSAGGLLMGAVLNMAPNLYKGVVAQVPIVDVVTTMLDETIPLTTGEWEEWGNPKEEQAYHYMLSYSPYDQVIAQEYPALLVTAGLHDSQVQYWEPAKWVAKLREMKTNDAPLLFHCDLQAGHGGASGRFASLQDTAREYVFILALAGITD